MPKSIRGVAIAAGLGSVAFCLVSVATADMAKVFPKKGSPLLGEVDATRTEIIIRNAAGEVRLNKADVERVEWVTPAKTVDDDYQRRFKVLAGEDVAGHFVLAEWLRDQERFDLLSKQCKYILGLEPDHRNAKLLVELAQQKLAEQAAAGAGGPGEPGEETDATDGLSEPPLLSERDINRLKLYEYPLDGRPEKVFVKFLKERSHAELERLVRGELGMAGKLDPQAERILERGQPHEKLQLILQTTGLKYADRIQVRGDTEVFKTFRQRILPLVAKGCTKSGCHGVREARVFRLPRGARNRDDVVYTSFLILDQLQTRHGPLIDRDLPGNSVLLGFMLPAEDNNQAHPPVKDGRLVPVLRGTQDSDFDLVLDWLNSLNVPHPKYELEYKFPEWLKKLEPPPEPAEEQAQPGAEPGEKEPAEEGGEEGEEEPSEDEPPEGEKEKDKPGGGGGDDEPP
jgi:hypothetical protein